MSDTIEMYEAPAVAEGDDPRTLAYVNVDDLLVDQNTQRAVTVERLRQMGAWDWEIAELPTVTVRDDGTMVVSEGQHRVTKRQSEAPGTRMWVALATDVEDERELALRISKGRRLHSKYDQWVLHVGQGLPHEVAAEQVLADMGLRVTATHSTVTDLGSVASVTSIIHSCDDPGDGAALLRTVLSILVQAFPQEPRRWDRLLMLAVTRILRVNDNVDVGRLIEKLSRQPALRWTQLSQQRHPGQSGLDVIGQAIVEQYNRSLRTRKIEW